MLKKREEGGRGPKPYSPKATMVNRYIFLFTFVCLYFCDLTLTFNNIICPFYFH